MKPTSKQARQHRRKPTRSLSAQLHVLYSFLDLSDVQDALLRLHVANAALDVLWSCDSFCYGGNHYRVKA